MSRTWGRAISYTLVIAAQVAAGCSVSNSPVTAPASQLDETVFACSVEPILARQCSYNACHGQDLTALRVYTPGKLRAMPPGGTSTPMIAALTQGENDGNFHVRGGVRMHGITSVDRQLPSLREATAGERWRVRAGQGVRGSGSGSGDPQYVAIQTWPLSGNGAACP